MLTSSSLITTSVSAFHKSRIVGTPGGLVFQKFSQKKGASEFSHGEWKVTKILVVLKKSECHYITLTNLF